MYDEGKQVFQASIQIEPEYSPEDIAAKVLKLEHKYYPNNQIKYSTYMRKSDFPPPPVIP